MLGNETRGASSRSARRRITKSERSNASSSASSPAAMKSWRICGAARARLLADRGLVDRDVAPADRRVPGLGDELADPRLRVLGAAGLAAQEAHRDAEAPGAGQLGGAALDLDRARAQEVVGDARS